MKDLSIIIVNYNVKEFIINLIESVKNCSPAITREIIIVDNNSTDGSVEVLSEKYPDIKIIANKENLGFGKANNQGYAVSQGKYVLLINPDTLVKEDAFELLIKKMEDDKSIGIAGCKVLNPDGTLQLACRRSFPGPWTSFTKITGLSSLFPKSKLFARYNLTYLNENESCEVDAISGAFMLIRREVYEKTKGFDPDFFMYGEDLDLCYRTQKAGYKVYYFHETEIIHYKGESTKRSNIDETRVFYEAMTMFVKKHLSSSFIVEIIINMAIKFRQTLTFINIYRMSVLSFLSDLLFLTAAIYFSEKLYINNNWPGFPDFVKPWVYIIPVLMQIIVSALSGVYNKKQISILRYWGSLVIGLVILTSSTFFFKQFAFSRAVVLIFYGFNFLSGFGWRVVAKLVFRLGTDTFSGKKRTLIVGVDEKAGKLSEKLQKSIHGLYEVVGFIGETYKDTGKTIGNFAVIGSYENIKKVVSDKKIDNIIFAAGSMPYNKIFSIISGFKGDKLEFNIAGTDHDFIVGKTSVTMLDDIPIMNITYNISWFSNRLIKRLFDILFGTGMILSGYTFLLPLFLIDNKNYYRKFLAHLPQVIRGKKSIIGVMTEEKNIYLGRQGITGLWFLEEDNSNTSEITKLDIYYAKNQNIWLDLEILGKTFVKFFQGKNA